MAQGDRGIEGEWVGGGVGKGRRKVHDTRWQDEIT